MFGIIYWMTCGIGSLISGTKCYIENTQRKNEYSLKDDNAANIYIDRKGVMRDLSTNHYAALKNDILTGDVWLCHGTMFNKIRNLSKEWRDNYYAELKEHPIEGKTVVNDICIKQIKPTTVLPNDKIIWKNIYYCKGQWFKDLETGKLLCARKIKGYDFYMIINTGQLLRLTDDQILKIKKKGENTNELEIQKIIEEFNSSRIIDCYHNDDYYWITFYLNHQEAFCQSAYEEHKMMGNVCPGSGKY